MTKFREIREKYLEEASSKGQELIENLDSVPELAQKTSAFGISAREDIQKNFRDGVENEAARFIGYEVTQEAREAAIYSLDWDNIEMDPGVVRGDTFFEQFARCCFLVDRLARGYNDLKPRKNMVTGTAMDPKRFPNPFSEDREEDFDKYVTQAMEESGSTSQDAVGLLAEENIYVVNDEWISYMMGSRPETLDEEAYDFLVEESVGL
jgi:hypothetical protein